ncbi:hypothetical protein D4R75_04920 [bacterium]|nr:MAG: hypothetical protein D4R75_04920 [bacterium]
MRLLINDRFIVPGLKPKCCVFLAEGDKSLHKGLLSGLSLQLSSGGESLARIEDSEVRVGEVGVFLGSSKSFSLPELAAGDYSLLLSLHHVPIDDLCFSVVSETDWQFLLRRLARDRMRHPTEAKTDEQMLSTFHSSWYRFAKYVGRPIDHVSFNPVIEGKFTRADVWPPLTAIDWCLFHLNRFVFDRVFFGGSVDFLAGEDKLGVYCVYKIRPDRQSKLNKLPHWLMELIGSLEFDGVSVDLSLSHAGRGVDLGVRLRKSSVVARDSASILSA